MVYEAHKGEVGAVAFSASLGQAVSGGEDGTVRVWDLTVGKEVKRLASLAAPVRSLAVSPDGERVFAGSGESAVRGWDLRTGQELYPASGHTRPVRGVAFSADGRLLLAPSADIEATLDRLRMLPGIGPWTAQYIAMRALAWPDAFPHTDLGVMKALGQTSPRRVLAAGEAWRPWRAYAVMHLWQRLPGPPSTA